MKRIHTFLWKIGFVCPPKPICLESYLRFPCGREKMLMIMWGKSINKKKKSEKNIGT